MDDKQLVTALRASIGSETAPRSPTEIMKMGRQRRRRRLVAKASGFAVLALAVFGIGLNGTSRHANDVTVAAAGGEEPVPKPLAEPNGVAPATLGPTTELAVDNPFRMATARLAEANGWRSTAAFVLPGDRPFEVVVYQLPDGRSIEFTHEVRSGPFDPSIVKAETMETGHRVDGNLDILRVETFPGVGGRVFVTATDGDSVSATLSIPKDARGQNDYASAQAARQAGLYRVGLDDLEVFARGLVQR